MEITYLIQRAKKLICSLGLFIISLPAVAAGFDCSEPGLNNTELTICNDTYLSGMDNALNTFFTAALENSINHGTLFREQRQWIQERNQCAEDIACIKEKYIERNRSLTAVRPFRSVEEVFNRDGDSLDPPMAQSLQNKNGFTLSEERWRVKLIIPDAVFTSAAYGLQDPSWRVLTHRVIDGDLVIYFIVAGVAEGSMVNYIVRVDEGARPKTLARYTSSDSQDTAIVYDPIRTDTIIYNVYQRPYSEEEGDSDYNVNTFEIDPFTNISKQIGSSLRSTAMDRNERWIGYCENQECVSRVTSPDGKWRLASRDSFKGDKDDGMFYFPADKPEQGVNVFLAQADTAKYDDFEYTRNYIWGDGNTFYFDNDGGLACIWKTDIENKLTQRILPVEGLLAPYYLKYDNEQMIISSYVSHVKKDGQWQQEVYIAKK
ncbi:TPA: lysozyme inhibitor LprI family protein [Klebsiella oxytoca]